MEACSNWYKGVLSLQVEGGELVKMSCTIRADLCYYLMTCSEVCVCVCGGGGGDERRQLRLAVGGSQCKQR